MSSDVDAARDPWQWVHDEVGLSWDDVNAIVVVVEAEWDKREAAIRAEGLDVERLARARHRYYHPTWPFGAKNRCHCLEEAQKWAEGDAVRGSEAYEAEYARLAEAER